MQISGAHVDDQLAKGENFLICPDHKTSDEYGEVIFLFLQMCETRQSLNNANQFAI